MPICDLDNDIKPYMGIPVSNTDSDTVLTIFRDSVEASVLSYVETKFELTTTSEILDSNGSDAIVPRNSPIASVQAIYIAIDSDGSGGNLLDPSLYRVDSHEITMRTAHFSRGRYYLKIDYTYGYDGVPAEVKHAILMGVEAEFIRKNKKTVGGGISARSKKDESESLGSGGGAGWDTKVGLPNEVIAKLQSYKTSFEFPTSPMATRNF